LCFIESDIVIRHFLQNKALLGVFENFNVSVVLPPKGWKRIHYDIDELELPVSIIRTSIPDERRMAWGHWFALDVLRIRFGYGWKRLRKNRWAIVGWRRGIRGVVASLPGIYWRQIKKLKRELKEVPATDLTQLIQKEKPDVIIHPSTFDGYFINDIINEGRKFGIPSLLLMNSWDNPSIKRSVIAKPDYVGVWGEQTRTHAVRFMGVDPDRVKIVGAAQFEVYREDTTYTKRELLSEHCFSQDTKVLLFASSSKRGNDFLHLVWLEEAIEEGVLPDWRVLYRPHPYGLPSNIAQKILNKDWKYVRVDCAMKKFMEDLVKSEPDRLFMADYRRTRDLLRTVDAVVSPLSTILIEAAIQGLPVMAFSPREEPGSAVWKSNKKLVHFDLIRQSKLILTAFCYADFLPNIQKLCSLVEDEEHAAKLREFSKRCVEFREGGYSNAVTELIDEALSVTDHATQINIT